jgi:MEDS: MEthanogen/methylotroph, DcmR Sensory domain
MSSETSTLLREGSGLDRFRHVCVFYDNTDQEYQVLESFISDGFAKGDKALHIIDDQHRSEHLKRLQALGIDVPASEQSGQLEIRGWSAPVIIDVLRSHPAAIIKGIAHENPFYASASEMLAELRRRQSRILAGKPITPVA